MKNNRLLLFFILSSLLLFVLYFALLSWNNRPCSDDLYFYANLMEKGWFMSISEMDMNIRWAGYLLFNTIFILQKDFADIPVNIFIYDLFSLAMVFFSAYRLLREISMKIFPQKVPSYIIMLSAMTFMSAFYFSTSQSAECWFWTIASVLYLIPLALLGIAVSCLISGKRTLRNYVCTALSFLYIGGAIENIALVVIVSLSVVIAFIYLKGKSIRKSVSLYWIALASCSVLFTFQLLSEGLSNRIELENKELSFEWMRLFQVMFQMKSLVFLLFLSIAFVIGQLLREANYILPAIRVKKTMLIHLIIVCFVAILTFLPLIYVFGNSGPERAWIPLNYVICCSLFFWALYSGNRFAKQSQVFRLLKHVSALTVIAVMSLYIYRHYPLVSAFARAYDSRTSLLLQKKLSGNTIAIYCEPLPDPGPLPGQELNNRDFRTNKGLERAIQIPFRIYLKE